MPNDVKPLAVLTTAYSWQCQQCGSTNYCDAAKAKLSDEDQETVYRQFHDLEDWQDLPEDWQCFEIVCIPDQVTCGHCLADHATKDERA